MEERSHEGIQNELLGADATTDQGESDTTSGEAVGVDAASNRLDCFGDPLPIGSLVRMGTVRLRHEHTKVASSPDGKLIATSSAASVRLWDASTGKLLRELRGFGAACFSPAGQLVVKQGVEQSLYALATGTARPQICFHGAGNVLTFSSDGKFLASQPSEGTILLWDLLTGKVKSRMDCPEGPAPWFVSAAFADNCSTLLALSLDKRLFSWRAPEGTLKHSMDLQLPQWRFLRFSPDGRTLAVIPYSTEPVQLWDTGTGTKRLQLKGEFSSSRYGLAFSPNSANLATDSNTTSAEQDVLSVWDTTTGALVRRSLFPPLTISQIDFLHDDRTLLLWATGAPLVRLWDSIRNNFILNYAAHEGAITGLAIMPDRHILLSGGADGTIRMWDSDTGRCLTTLQRRKPQAVTVDVLPGGRTLTSFAEDGDLVLWDVSTRKQLLRRSVNPGIAAPTFTSPYGILAIAKSCDGKRAATYSWPMDLSKRQGRPPLLSLWDLNDGKLLFTRTADNRSKGSELCLFSPELDSYLGFSRTPLMPPASLPPQAPAKIALPVGPPSVPLPRSDTTHMVLRGLSSNEVLAVVPQPDHYAYQQAFAPDGRSFATATYSMNISNGKYCYDSFAIHLWETATGGERLRIICPGHGDMHRFQKLAFAPNGGTLAAACADYPLPTIHLWDLATGQEVSLLKGYSANVSCLTFSRDGSRLASGHTDTTVLLWDVGHTLQKGNALTDPHGKQDIQLLWNGLADTNATKAYRSMWELVAAGDGAVKLIRTQVAPAPSVKPQVIDHLIQDLDARSFGQRNAATQALADMEEVAFPALQKALKTAVSNESRARIESLLSGPKTVRSPRNLQTLRAVEVLEHIGTSEAKEVLALLSRGTAASRVTQESLRSLARLTTTNTAGP